MKRSEAMIEIRYGHMFRRDEEQLTTLTYEEIRRCGMEDIAEKVKEARLR